MYKKSIKENSKYLTPYIEGIKYYGSNEIEQGIGTMIIINSSGDVLTCRHIAERFLLYKKLIDNYENLISELSKVRNKEERKRLEKKYNLKKGSIVLSDIKLLIDICDNNGNYSFDVIIHDYLDIAVIKFKTSKINIDTFPIFSEKLPEQGQSVCRLGYAFPEYDIFEYSEQKNAISIKKEIVLNFPLFPIDGIVTRHVVDEKGEISMFETSSPGLRGQSGGPIFNPDGEIYGMQSKTIHLDLNFDINNDVKRGIEKKKICFTPFINLGIGISSVKIIEFLKANNIKFQSK